MSKVIELNDTNFDSEVSKSSKPVIIDFFAPWCGHCKVQDPILDAFAKEIGEKALVAKINVDNNINKAAEYGISGIPAFVVIKNGKLVKQFSGLRQKADLGKIIAEFI